MTINLDAIPNALEFRLGMPRPDWTAIWDWMNENVPPEEQNEAWQDFAGQWLNRLRQSLSIEYMSAESEHFRLLSAGDSATNDRILRWCELFRRSILATLDGVARDESYGKHILLAFHDRKAFFDYVLDYFPDVGEFASVGGMFLDGGYAHTAICLEYELCLDRTIAHELTHAMLRHLPLPMWLDEGVTLVVEDIAVGGSNFQIDGALARRHKAYWNKHGIHSFWSGDSFYSADDGQELSYSLAQVLVRNLISDFPKCIPPFLNKAQFADAGNAALLEACGTSLSQRAEQFLGGGSWAPRSDYGQLPELPL